MKRKKDKDNNRTNESWNTLKLILDFIWKGNSFLSLILQLVIALFVVKFIFYPLLGIVLGTKFPIVAVVSSSMEHNGMKFDKWWNEKKDFYLSYNITKEEFENFVFHNGFNKGDLIVLTGVDKDDVEIGNVVVYWSGKKYPIIHRIIDVYEENGEIFLATKGDNNPGMIVEPPLINEKIIQYKSLVGEACFRIPYLGYIKIIFTKIVEFFI